jgi:hypothetical protein
MENVEKILKVSVQNEGRTPNAARIFGFELMD